MRKTEICTHYSVILLFPFSLLSSFVYGAEHVFFHPFLFIYSLTQFYSYHLCPISLYLHIPFLFA